MIPTLLTSILSGNNKAGGERKEIIYPYSGSSSRFFEYARAVAIKPFIPVDDISVFRAGLFAVVHALQARLETEKDTILRTVALETGSPISYHLEDMEGACMFLTKLSHLEKLLPKKYLSEPKGNVLLNLSANEPIIVTTILALTALYVGNAVFIKPSTKTPSYGYFLTKELTKNQFLKDRVHFLLTDREETERLIRLKSFDFVLSLGSSATNKKIMTLCAESETEFLPESEGNDWCYVDKACDPLKKISKIIAESFTKHNGQMCNAVRGVMVHEDTYEAFVKLLKKKVPVFSVGSSDVYTSHISALIEGTQMNAHTLVSGTAEKAEEVWNYSVKDNVISPTLILNPGDEAPILSETIFAPILWVKKVKDHAEAISFYQKRNKHGLGFSVFSYDRKVVDDFIRRIRTGRININKHPLKTRLFDPLGGILLSGRGGPSHWVERFSNRKFVNQYLPKK